MPYCPQLRHCIFIRTRTQAYMEKGLGADFHKLPRATAMVTLSAVRKIIVWILCAPMLDTQLHTQRYPHRSQDFPHRLRFTRVLLWSKDLSMWFCLPLCVWLSGLNTNSNEIGPEKRSPRTAFPPGGKWSSQKAEQASLLRASRGSQPACV